MPAENNGVLAALIVGLTCSQSLRFRTPYNYIMLFGFTAFLSFFVAVIVSRYDTLTVLIAVGIVSVMVGRCRLKPVFASTE